MYKSVCSFFLSTIVLEAKDGTDPIHLTPQRPVRVQVTVRSEQKENKKYLVLCPTPCDHACASRRRSRTRYRTSAASPSRHRTPRCLYIISSFALPLVDQAPHALIWLLRRRRLCIVARSGGRGGGDGADRYRPHGCIEFAATTRGIKFHRRAAPAIRHRRFSLYRKARKANRRSVFYALPIRSTDTRRRLLRRVRCEPG